MRFFVFAIIVFATFADSAGAAPPLAPSWTASLDVSAETMKVPGTNFLYRYNATTSVQTALADTHDGKLKPGPRFDLAIGKNIDTATWVGATGFFAYHGNSANIFGCKATTVAPTSRCAASPLFDPNTGTTNIFYTLPGELINTDAERNARHWGFAVEARHSRTVAAFKSTIKAGLAYKRIDTALSVRIASTSTAGTLSYDETLNTHYLGPYIGFAGSVAVGGGWFIAAETEAGIYAARTSFDGLYASNIPGNPNSTFGQSLSLSSNTIAGIVSGKLSIDKDFGRWTLGMFGRADYYSRAPKMTLNTYDAPTYTTALNTGTSIDYGEATALSAGLRVTLRLP